MWVYQPYEHQYSVGEMTEVGEVVATGFIEQEYSDSDEYGNTFYLYPGNEVFAVRVNYDECPWVDDFEIYFVEGYKAARYFASTGKDIFDNDTFYSWDAWNEEAINR